MSNWADCYKINVLNLEQLLPGGLSLGNDAQNNSANARSRMSKEASKGILEGLCGKINNCTVC